MLFLCDISVDDRGLSLPQLFDLWEKEADAALHAKAAGLIKSIYKVVGQRRVFTIIEAPSHDMIDDIAMAKLPMAHHLKFNSVVPIREYEDFAKSLKKRFAD
jgi:muconolactone delta-isomerase